MWGIFEDLYAALPSDIKVDECVISDYVAYVNAGGNIGIARLIDKPCHDSSEYTGKTIKEVADYSKWQDNTQSAVGMAAMNAWYNSKEKISRLEELQAESESVTSSSNIAVVGDCVRGSSGRRVDVFPLPMVPEFDHSEYEELHDYDTVIISADAFVSGAMSAIVEMLGRDANVIIEGISTPAAASLITSDSPIKIIKGFYENKGNTEVKVIDQDSVLTPFILREIKEI